MDNPWLVTCGLVCAWPLFVGLVGFMLGRRAIAFRSPIYRADRAGYASDKMQSERLAQTIRSPSK